MKQASLNKLWDLRPSLGGFFIPKKEARITVNNQKLFKQAILIPTYQPTTTTYSLVNNVIRWYPEILLVVIDDSTPLSGKNTTIINKLKKLALTKRQVVYLRTQHNSMKAGALNFGLNYLLNLKSKPQVVFAFDDDIRINKKTLPLMVDALYSEKKIGAVCSLALVRNKNKNWLTRLQSLEYHNFNITKIADNNFLSGPLVMQGMLTAFRMSAINAIGGYTDNHLIEDYDITAKLKTRGFRVKIAQRASAWTTVPANFEALWRQRVRWSFGGLHVVKDYWKIPAATFQDLTGHILFLSLLSLVTTSLIMQNNHTRGSLLATLLILFAVTNLIVGLAFNLLTLYTYPKKDKTDLLIKALVLPEFIYSNLLSLVLLGSYLFFIYRILGKLGSKKIKRAYKAYAIGLNLFGKMGYANSWGTHKHSYLKGGVRI